MIKLQPKEVYANYLKKIVNRKIKSIISTKDALLFSLETNAHIGRYEGKYPKWIGLAHQTIKNMDLPKLHDGKEYTLRINPDGINIIVFELYYDEELDRMSRKEYDEWEIYSGKTHGYVKFIEQ